MTEPQTMKELIDRSGFITRFRWWLFNRLTRWLYWVCPEPHRSYLRAIWAAKMGDFKEAARKLEARHD